MSKQKITDPRTDDADGSVDPHTARAPALSLAEQHEKMQGGEVWGSTCNACHHDQIGPMNRCPKCGSRDVGVRQFSATGKVVSYTIQTVAPEQFMNEVPYAFAVIQLDDGPKVSGWIPWISKPAELPSGSKVTYTPTYKPGFMFEKG